jgi:exodeoxyribonuclease V alpha subunit
MVPESSDDGKFVFVETEEPLQALIAAAKKMIADGVDPDDIQTLSPTHKGDAGCMSLNKALQELFNPVPATTSQRLKRDSGDIFVNDRVLQGKNDKALSLVNGDVGWVASFDSSKGILGLMLPDKATPVMMDTSQAINLKLAYAITVHKSQGAEAPYIFIALDRSATFMLRRNLVYTAITRGVKKVFLFSPRDTLEIAVRKGEPAEGSRRTSLVPKLLKAFEGRPRPVIAAAPKVDPLAEAMRVAPVFADVDI